MRPQFFLLLRAAEEGEHQCGSAHRTLALLAEPVCDRPHCVRGCHDLNPTLPIAESAHPPQRPRHVEIAAAMHKPRQAPPQTEQDRAWRK